MEAKLEEEKAREQEFLEKEREKRNRKITERLHSIQYGISGRGKASISYPFFFRGNFFGRALIESGARADSLNFKFRIANLDSILRNRSVLS